MNNDREADKLLERWTRLNDQLVAVTNHMRSINANMAETEKKLSQLGVFVPKNQNDLDKNTRFFKAPKNNDKPKFDPGTVTTTFEQPAKPAPPEKSSKKAKSEKKTKSSK